MTHPPQTVTPDQVTERPRRGRRAKTEGDERGYVLAMTALLLIPMMVFAALAVDVGGWYATASAAQRAADASALAAVVYMPDIDKARNVALSTAAQNGYAADQVTFSVINSQSVRVDIVDQGALYFGSVVRDTEVDIQRFATAEYILPVPMGNPTSALGTGNLTVPGERMWLAVNSYCSGREQGDQFSTRYQGAAWLCPGIGRQYLRMNGVRYYIDPPGAGTLNPQYREEGYYIVVDMPPASAGTSYDIQLYDPGYCDYRAEGVYSAGGVYPTVADMAHADTTLNTTVLETRLYKADLTQITDEDNIRPDNMHGVSPRAWAANACGWQTAYTIGGSELRGRWILNYRSLPDTRALGMNIFSIRVVPSGTSTICTNTGAGSACPKVSAKDWLPIYAPNVDKNGVAMSSPGAPVSFYLAHIDEVHRGKTLELQLYDPGEGMDNMQILAPNLTRHPFVYETIDQQLISGFPLTDYAPANAPTCAISAAVAAADPTTPAAGNYHCLRVTDQRYNNRTVRITLPIPNDYTCDATNGCWWRIRYQPESGVPVTDRTTWGIRVIGDPVRLAE